MTPETAPTVGIIGAGRAGVGLALACRQAGLPVRLHSRRVAPFPNDVTVTTGALPPPWIGEVQVVLLAVPDAAIGAVAAALRGAVGARHVVLHLSGVLDAGALEPLADSGAALGSFHPLLSFADPASAPARLREAVAAVEGDERGRVAAGALARRLGLTPFELEAAYKARYHAGAVFGANFLVTIAAVARRVFTQAGVPADQAAKGLATLMAGVLANVARDGPEGALTGPLKRGDIGTVRANLRALDPAEAELYRVLSRATLDVAGLDPEVRAAIERALEQ